MKLGGPKVAARQGGGSRQGFGHFDEEHLEQGASASAVQQKQLAQQAAQVTQKPAAAQQSSAGQPPATPPREVSDPKDELLIRPAKDIVEGVKSIFSLHDLLNIHPGDTPEEQEKKKTLNQRFEKLTEEQQAVAKKLFQEKMQKDKAAEEEEEQKKQAKARQKEADKLAPPSSPRKGPIGPAGSGKQKAAQQIQQQRQSIGQVAGAN